MAKIRLNEAVPLYCPNCSEDLGKDVENPKKASCGTCGKSGIHNPRGYNEQPYPSKKKMTDIHTHLQNNGFDKGGTYYGRTEYKHKSSPNVVVVDDNYGSWIHAKSIKDTPSEEGETLDKLKSHLSKLGIK